MSNFKKAMVGTAAAGAMALSATPAMARHGHNKVDAGEVIAGAVILGGLAAILSSGKKDRYRDYDRGYGYRGDGYRDGRSNRSNYGHRDSIRPRKAVKKCVRAAERRASRYGYADVTQIRDVERTRYGWKVKGRIAVKSNHRGDYYRSDYGRGHGRGYRHSGYNRGKFTCYVEGRRISSLRLKGFGNYR